jgi:hypothetical protein
MAKSLTQLSERFADLSRNNEATHIARGIEMINDAAMRRLYGYDYVFLEKTRQFDTVAGQYTYPIPIDVSLIRTVSTDVGTQRYVLQEVATNADWQRLFFTPLESNIASWFYVENNTISIYPTPSENGVPVYINYKSKIYPCKNLDYTTGTLTFTHGSKVVTHSAVLPTWITIQGYVTDSNGMSYDIATRDSNTQLTLVQPYIGVSGAQTTLISQGFPFPDGLEYIPLYDALSDYYLGVEGKSDESRLWKDRADEMVAMLNSQFGMKTASLRIRYRGDFGDFAKFNPNSYPQI